MRSKHWYVMYQGNTYANNLDFYESLNELEVREYLRKFHNVKRLFTGTQIWVA